MHSSEEGTRLLFAGGDGSIRFHSRRYRCHVLRGRAHCCRSRSRGGRRLGLRRSRLRCRRRGGSGSAFRGGRRGRERSERDLLRFVGRVGRVRHKLHGAVSLSLKRGQAVAKLNQLEWTQPDQKMVGGSH